MSTKGGRPENLIPAKPGEVRNPEGRNQYTYRRRAEEHLDEWCKEHGRELVRKVCEQARAGKPWAAKLLLDRILPTIQKHELTVPDRPQSHRFVPSEEDQARLEAELRSEKVIH